MSLCAILQDLKMLFNILGLQILGSCEKGMKVYHHKLTINSFLYDFLTQNNKDFDFFFSFTASKLTKGTESNVKDNKSGQFSYTHCVQCP